MKMANSTITIKSEYRPCEIDGKKALFHKWIEEESVIVKLNIAAGKAETIKMLQEIREMQFCPHCAEVEKVKSNFALVEYEDGTISKVAPETITFLDGNVNSILRGYAI